jgi:DNA-binding transcriptional LysR family regulator
LEDVAGAPLFRRSVKRMLPTARGKSLYDQVFESLDRLDRVSRNILRLGDPSLSGNGTLAVIRLGTSADYFDSFALERLVRTGLQFAVSFGDSKELLGQLQAGMLDAVVSVARPAVRALRYRILAEQRFLLVGPQALEPPNLALIVADLRTVLHAVELGMGITLLPEYICSTALRTGTIRKLWPVDQFIDEDRWILSFRELDADQPAILKLAEALT